MIRLAADHGQIFLKKGLKMDELKVLALIQKHLSKLTVSQRKRVLQYLNDVISDDSVDITKASDGSLEDEE